MKPKPTYAWTFRCSTCESAGEEVVLCEDVAAAWATVAAIASRRTQMIRKIELIKYERVLMSVTQERLEGDGQ